MSEARPALRSSAASITDSASTSKVRHTAGTPAGGPSSAGDKLVPLHAVSLEGHDDPLEGPVGVQRPRVAHLGPTDRGHCPRLVDVAVEREDGLDGLDGAADRMAPDRG